MNRHSYGIPAHTEGELVKWAIMSGTFNILVFFTIYKLHPVSPIFWLTEHFQTYRSLSSQPLEINILCPYWTIVDNILENIRYLSSCVWCISLKMMSFVAKCNTDGDKALCDMLTVRGKSNKKNILVYHRSNILHIVFLMLS